jgi:hypothetical protein
LRHLTGDTSIGVVPDRAIKPFVTSQERPVSALGMSPVLVFTFAAPVHLVLLPFSVCKEVTCFS